MVFQLVLLGMMELDCQHHLVVMFANLLRDKEDRTTPRDLPYSSTQWRLNARAYLGLGLSPGPRPIRGLNNNTK